MFTFKISFLSPILEWFASFGFGGSQVRGTVALSSLIECRQGAGVAFYKVSEIKRGKNLFTLLLLV